MSTYLMMIVGIFECVAGIVVAAFGVLEILRTLTAVDCGATVHDARVTGSRSYIP